MRLNLQMTHDGGRRAHFTHNDVVAVAVVPRLARFIDEPPYVAEVSIYGAAPCDRSTVVRHGFVDRSGRFLIRSAPFTRVNMEPVVPETALGPYMDWMEEEGFDWGPYVSAVDTLARKGPEAFVAGLRDIVRAGKRTGFFRTMGIRPVPSCGGWSFWFGFPGSTYIPLPPYRGLLHSVSIQSTFPDNGRALVVPQLHTGSAFSWPLLTGVGKFSQDHLLSGSGLFQLLSRAAERRAINHGERELHEGQCDYFTLWSNEMRLYVEQCDEWQSW